MKQGYKQTDIGVIPEDWEIVKFRQLGIPSKSRINPKIETDNFKCIELEHINQETGLLNGYANSKDLLSQKAIFEKGDILFGKLRPYLKKYWFAEFDGVCTTEIWVLKPTRKVSNKYLFYLVQSDRIIESANLSTGTKMPRAEWKVVGETELAVSNNLIEQTAIATALSDTDALIAALDKKIAKKQQIKQGAMQQLLTGKKRLSGFSGEWVEKKLGECTDINRGGSPRPIEKYLTSAVDGINWIKIGDVGLNAKYIESTEEKIIPEGVTRSRYVKKGDFLLSNSMSFGRPYILKVDGCIHDGWLVIQNYQDTFDTNYLYYILGFETILAQYKSVAAGSSVLNLNKQIVSNVVVTFPLKSEQTAIAQILTDMDNEIAQLEKERDKYKELKAGMMQVLLTGKIRLI